MVAKHQSHCEQTLMFTDIVGYSRLMGRNETLAIEMLGDYRKILLSHIEQQNGQPVEFIGDAVFARFDSAASATAAAIAIQQHLQAFNEARDKKLPPLQTRIGLHKGEVTLRDGAVFGDSVNIAARLEPLAVADGICLSQSVYDEIRFSLSSPAKRLGTQTLKNIEQKIRVYLIKPSGIGWRDHLFYFLRDINKKIHAYRYPLTACLFALVVAGFYFIPRWLVPGYAANYVEIADFKNLMDKSGDADYFSAGITSAVRSQLADMRDVYIVDAKEGIHAPIRLEGSVQKLDDNLRISYRLFRRKDNVQIAGGKLDGTYQDIFILQDRLVGEIARYLADEFELQNFRPAPLRLTGDVTAYDYYLRGLDYLDRPISHKNIDEAIKNFNTSLIHDAAFPLAHTGICSAYWRKYEVTGLVDWLEMAEKYCLDAIAKNETFTDAYRTIGAIYRDVGRYEESVNFLEKGYRLNKNDVSILVILASSYDLMGNSKKSESTYLEAMALFPKSWIASDGYGYFLTRNGRHDEAISVYEKSLELNSSNPVALNNIAINYMYKDDFKNAASMFEKSSLLEPRGYVYANAGSMYYSLRDFIKASELYEKATFLEPENYQFLLYLAESYKFIPERVRDSEIYFKRVVDILDGEIKKNKKVAKHYQYLSRAYIALGDIESAKKFISIANSMDSSTAESFYSNLRLAIANKDEESIKLYSLRLLDTEYSAKLLLSDPDLAVLNEERYRGIFFN